MVSLSVVAVALFAALTLQLGSPTKANAAEFQFCYGVNVAGWSYCETNTSHWMDQAYAWGEEGGICVAVRPNPQVCGGANQGVYTALEAYEPTYAFISNSVDHTNRVHGFYLTPE